MTDKIEPCPESPGKSYCPRHKREGQRRVGFRCICAELEVAWILGAGSRTPDGRLEAERAVIEAAKEVAAGWLNGRTISGERDSMNELIAALTQPAPEKGDL